MLRMLEIESSWRSVESRRSQHLRVTIVELHVHGYRPPLKFAAETGKFSRSLCRKKERRKGGKKDGRKGADAVGSKWKTVKRGGALTRLD